MDAPEKQTIPLPALVLGVGGLLPFVFAALIVIFPGVTSLIPDIAELPAATSDHIGVMALGAYGAVILSFLGGVRWGKLLDDQVRLQAWTPLGLSVVPSLIAWPALLFSKSMMLSLLIAGFVFQYVLDARGVNQGILPVWFGKLRLLLTSGAVLCLAIGLMGVIA